jgi:hypothetical protein
MTDVLTMHLHVRVRVDIRRLTAWLADSEDDQFEVSTPLLEGHVKGELEAFLADQGYVIALSVDDAQTLDNERIWRSRGAPPSAVCLPKDDIHPPGPPSPEAVDRHEIPRGVGN